MRIIAGQAKGLRLSVPEGVRPTPDRVREALFSILGDRCAGATVLDAFAGSGALGLEALSRGASDVLLIERRPGAARTLRENVIRTGLSGAQVQEGDVRRIVRSLAQDNASGGFDLVFIDPPFETRAQGEIAERITKEGLLAPEGRVVVEHPADETLQVAGLSLADARRYGTVALSMFENKKG